MLAAVCCRRCNVYTLTDTRGAGTCFTALRAKSMGAKSVHLKVGTINRGLDELYTSTDHRQQQRYSSKRTGVVATVDYTRYAATMTTTDL